jgi:hypothetical protein
MVTLLITSFLVLAGLGIALYYWQKPASVTESEPPPLPPGQGLFIDGTTDGKALAQAAVDSERAANKVAKRRELLERAQKGEKSCLLAARDCGDAELYEEVLDLLVAAANSDLKLLSLVSYVTRQELPVNRRLAERFIDSYESAPDRSSTAKMLHVAALSDDAAIYQSAVEIAFGLWRGGRLPDVSAPELRSIIDGEFWILSSPTRSSGAGFLLKRTLAKARRELSGTTGVNH